jgi:SAM-dependent methyltransferase
VLHDLVRGFVDTEAYARGRPRLGPQPVAVICEAVGGPRVLELGAGTGLVSRALVDAGLDVVALEPLAAMRAQLKRAIGAERVLAGRAEAIPLADGSVDGAVASDAFHRFDGPRAAAELHRVVRPGGGVVVCVTDAAGADSRPAWELDLGAVLHELRDAAGHPHARGPRRPEALAEHGGITDVRHRSVPFTHLTDRDGMLAYVASMSFVGVLPAPRRAEVLARVGTILDRHGVVRVELPMTAELWLTRRRPGPARPPGRTAAG